jgi:hypothetical protein
VTIAVLNQLTASPVYSQLCPKLSQQLNAKTTDSAKVIYLLINFALIRLFLKEKLCADSLLVLNSLVSLKSLGLFSKLEYICLYFPGNLGIP